MIIAGKYSITNKIGYGGFSTVYEAKNMQTYEMVAIKISSSPTEIQDKMHDEMHDEVATQSISLLHREAKLIMKFKHHNGFPQIRCYGSSKGVDSSQNYEYMVMDRLGYSLEELKAKCGGYFSVSTVAMIAQQTLNRLKHIHQKGIIHRDIKPDNFVIGFGIEKQKQIYIIDFGLSKCYIDRSNKHITYCEGKSPVGTTTFASLNSHRGCELSRRDDLESLGYTLIYLLSGSLSWDSVDNHYNESSIMKKHKLVGRQKSEVSIDNLCKGLPSEFFKYMTYCRSLGFREKPNYDYLIEIFKILNRKIIKKGTALFDWEQIYF